MEVPEFALFATAGAFAVFNGMNDGGSILATTLKTTSVSPLYAVLVLAVVAGMAPLVFGTQVATTLVHRLADFQGAGGRLAIVIAVLSAVAVVLVLSREGLPTSLTLALLGGIVGVGIGGGLPISWGWVLLVLVLAAVAPFAGLVGAILVRRIWTALPLRLAVPRQVRHGHRVGFGFLTVSYGVNDGQKMLAVFVIATPAISDGSTITPPIWLLALITVLFATGALLRLRHYAATLGASVVPVTPAGAVTAQFSAATAVIATGAVGVPVSMTQSIAGALIGTTVSERGAGAVRWSSATRIAAAWIVTLPVAAIAAGTVGWLVLEAS